MKRIVFLFLTRVIIITTLCILRNIHVLLDACVDSGHIHTLRHVHIPSHMYTHTHTHICKHSCSHMYAAGYVTKEKPVLKQRCVIICVTAQFEPLVNHSTRVYASCPSLKLVRGMQSETVPKVWWYHCSFGR